MVIHSSPNAEKIYYTISEVSEIVQEPDTTLRHWEKEFNELLPARSTRGHRRYTKADIKIIQQIQFLLRTNGLSIEAARKRILHLDKADHARIEVIARLTNDKKLIDDFLKQLKAAEAKKTLKSETTNR